MIHRESYTYLANLAKEKLLFFLTGYMVTAYYTVLTGNMFLMF